MKRDIYTHNFCDTEKWKDFLNINGFVVIRDVMSQEDIDLGINLFEKHLQKIDGNISLDNPRSLNVVWPVDDDGFMPNLDLHSSKFAWYSRCRPKVLEVHRSLYNLKDTNELITTFDGVNSVRNLNYGDKNWSWKHIDYPLNDPPDFECYQSMLNYIDCTAKESPCLRVSPKSHKLCNHTCDKNDTGAFFQVKGE